MLQTIRGDLLDMDEGRVVIFICCCLSLGITQIINNIFICERFNDKYSTCSRYSLYRLFMKCQSHHVILITNFSISAFNESDDKTCCSRLPSGYCIANFDVSVLYGMEEFLKCYLTQRCSSLDIFELDLPHRLQHLTNNCSASEYMFHADYTCVTNSTIVNMTHATVNTSIGELSLSYSRMQNANFPKMNDSFYCSCEVSASRDTSIYPKVYSIKLYDNELYNTSLSIYTRSWDVRYDRHSQDMMKIQNKKYVLYRTFQSTRGPVRVVYRGEQLPTTDMIWINFRVNEGKIQTKCDGCKKGKYSPPVFDGKNENEEIQTTASPINTTLKIDAPDGYKSAFISLIVILIIAGIGVTVAYVYWRRRNKDGKSIQSEVAAAPAEGRERGTGIARGRGRRREDAVRQEVSRPAIVNELYDSLDLTQPYSVYDNLNEDSIYANQISV